MTVAPPGFTGSPLDRLDAVRHDPAQVAGLAARPGARLLVLDAHQPRTRDGRLLWESMPSIAPHERALLGAIDGAPRFVRLDPTAAARRTPELMALLAELAPGEAATYAAARSLTDWHARHRFCANCGHATAPFRAGWARACPACATEHFPRSDPVVIMLAEHGSGSSARVLVGRQPAFPPGRYSALAGFVEVGESIEEAVARELWEEAGLRVGAVRYVASQPWPFPSQLMIACIAAAPDDTIRLDRAELEDARWVTRAEVAAALAGDPAAPFVAPPGIAIARTLLETWALERWALETWAAAPISA